MVNIEMADKKKKIEAGKVTGGKKASVKKASPKKEGATNVKAEEKSAKSVSKKAPKKEVKVKEVKETKKTDVMASLDDKEVVVTKEENKKAWKEILLKVWDIAFWVLFIAIALTWVTDYFRVRADKDPQFCLAKKTKQFEDGTVETCTGVGYKIYSYNRESLDTGVEFVPFFVKMKEPKTSK